MATGVLGTADMSGWRLIQASYVPADTYSVVTVSIL